MKHKLFFIFFFLGIIALVIGFSITRNSFDKNIDEPNVFKADDKLQFTLELGDNPQLMQKFVADNDSGITKVLAQEIPQSNTYVEGDLTIKTSLVNAYKDQVYPLNLTIEKQSDTTYLIKSNNLPEEFSPGVHELKVEIEQNGQTQTVSQNFSWGVLAINTNKAAYTPKETAKIAMAVLDENGGMVCDADIELTISDPRNNTTILSSSGDNITINPGCRKKELILEPDYETEYTTGRTGTYTMTLKATTSNGVNVISDTFEVQNDLPFEIERLTATRIYPAFNYPVLIKVTANHDYNGPLTETFPKEFKVETVGQSEIEEFYNIKMGNSYGADFTVLDTTLTWNVRWQKGNTYYYAYKYDAPNRSPDFYTLGPLKTDTYVEPRKWQIAVDAIPTVLGYATSSIGTDTGTFTMDMTTKHPAGDLYVAVMCHDGTISVNAPTGGDWTEVADIREHAAYYKIGEDEGGGNELSSYNWDSAGGNEAWAGAIMRITGFDTSSPLNVATTTASNGTDSSPVAPSITPTLEDTLIIRSTGVDNDTFSAGWGPTDHTEVASGNSGGAADCSFAIATMDTSPAADAAAGTATFGGGVNDSWGASTIAIQSTDAPTVSYPFDNAETKDTTPTFEFTGYDLDGTANIIYEIAWDDNYALSSPTTKASDTDVGFANTEDASDTDPFTDGEKVSYTIQPGDALSNSSANTAYYWHVRSKKSGGSYGSWSEIYSFRVNTSLKVDRWLQTTDEQFDKNVLIKTQTAGLDNIEVIGGTMPGVAINGTASTNASTSTHTSLSVSHTVSGSQTILFVICQGENQSVSSVTWGTDSLTNISGASRNASGTMISTWYITGVTGTETATCNLSSQDNSGITAISFTGVSPYNPIGAVEVAGANSNTITQSFDTSYDDSLILEIITGDGGDTDPFAPTSGQTERWDFESGGGSANADTGYAGYTLAAATSGNYNLNATQNVTDDYSYAAIEIRAYDPNVGSALSSRIEFGYLPNMSSWKEFDFNGTGDVTVSVYYTVAAVCDTVVPNAALATNEAGFSSGPVDLSGLDPGTYSTICLYASLNDASSTIDDWYVSWSFNVSGTVYLADKSTQATTGAGGQCNSSTANLTLVVDGSGPITTTCSSTDGSFTFEGVEAGPGNTITMYSTNATDKSNRVYNANGSVNTGQDLYKNAIAVLDLYDGTLDITEMVDYDNDQNSADMLFDAENSSPDTVTWEAGTNLYVPTSESFAPGGNTNGHDIEIDGSWIATGSETINVDGSFNLDTNGTFIPATSTLTFDASSGTEYLFTAGAGSLYNLTVNDGGGSLTVVVADELDVDNDLTITNGTLDVQYANSGYESYMSNDTFTVPLGVTEITVKTWGGGGGGGAGGSVSVGGIGAGGGFSQATISVTEEEDLDIIVGAGGTHGTYAGTYSGGGGGGGGRTAIERAGTPLLIAAGGAGGGGGDNSSATAGGAGGAGGGTSGTAGSASGSAGGGGAGTSLAGGAGGTGGGNAGAAGSSEAGGLGGNGGSDSTAGDGGALNGGSPNGGHGGTGNTSGFAGGGGGGDGYYGGGGGSGSASGNAGGGGGGGGSSYYTGSSTSTQSGSGIAAGNTGDTDYVTGRGMGATGGALTQSGGDGTGGLVFISYSGSAVPQDIYVGRNWTNDDIFLERTGNIIFDGASDATIDSGCSDEDTCTNENFYNIRIERSEDSEITLLNTPIRITNIFYILTGIFNQGDENVRGEGTTALEVKDFGRYRSLLTGDLTLGGNVLNDGEITLNGNGSSCGDADDITIASTAAVARTWSGAGGYRITDAAVSYQTGSAIIHVGSGTDSGNNGSNWAFIDCGIIELNGLNITGININ